MTRLKDEVAIVSGAASGFGEGMAKRFAGVALGVDGVRCV